VGAGRGRGASDLLIGEGLARLDGERVAELGYTLKDYAREVLGLKRRDAEAHVHFARELRTRPLVREAVLAGRITYRAAQEILPVAVADAEAAWVERASKETVRALHAAVAAERKAAAEAEADWVRLSVRMRPEERAVVDEALEVADKLTPGRSRGQRLEAMAQEVIGMVAAVVEDPEKVRLGNAFRVPRPQPDPSARDEAMENDNEHWSHMPPVPALKLPTVDFRSLTSAEEIDRELRKQVKEQALRNRYMGFAAATLQDARLFETLGYSGFRQYCEERLGLSARAVEERARLEREVGSRRALRDARKAGLSYAKLKLLARLPDRLVREWIGKAMGMTCIDLARKLESDRDRHMRAQHRLEAPMERGAALTLAAAIGAVRKLCDTVVSDGKCLAILAQHFLDTYRGQVKRPKTRAQKVRERDHYCQVPGCSNRAMHSHHKQFRSHGGSDELGNQLGVCAYHHLRCIHTGYLVLITDKITGEHRWYVKGKRFLGGVERDAAPTS
jgi:hypothetical protein